MSVTTPDFSGAFFRRSHTSPVRLSQLNKGDGRDTFLSMKDNRPLLTPSPPSSNCSRSSPVPSPTGPRRRLFVSESTRTGDDSERSTIVLTTPGFITHTICCPEVAGNVSTVITALGDKSPTQLSILKTPGQSSRWTHSQLFHTGKQHTTVVRFNPVVVVKFITENGIECFDHTQPITSDNKNTRRSHFRRQKSLPVVKLPSIS